MKSSTSYQHNFYCFFATGPWFWFFLEIFSTLITLHCLLYIFYMNDHRLICKGDVYWTNFKMKCYNGKHKQKTHNVSWFKVWDFNISDISSLALVIFWHSFWQMFFKRKVYCLGKGYKKSCIWTTLCLLLRWLTSSSCGGRRLFFPVGQTKSFLFVCAYFKPFLVFSSNLCNVY